MAGDHDKLRETLDQLQTQLDEMRKLDPTLAANLAATIGEAQAVLGGRPTRAEAHGSLVERLRAAVFKYEASHPGLAGNLGSVIDALGRMGI